jgi:hypothetical protein
MVWLNRCCAKAYHGCFYPVHRRSGSDYYPVTMGLSDRSYGLGVSHPARLAPGRAMVRTALTALWIGGSVE